MNAAKTITQLRKAKNWSQNDLASKTGISQVMVGKYERGEASPSIEVAKNIADVFEVSLDYLVGEGQNATFDKTTVKRLKDIQALDDNTKNHLFFLIDNVIQNFKTKQAFS